MDAPSDRSKHRTTFAQLGVVASDLEKLKQTHAAVLKQLTEARAGTVAANNVLRDSQAQLAEMNRQRSAAIEAAARDRGHVEELEAACALLRGQNALLRQQLMASKDDVASMVADRNSPSAAHRTSDS